MNADLVFAILTLVFTAIASCAAIWIILDRQEREMFKEEFRRRMERKRERKNS